MSNPPFKTNEWIEEDVEVEVVRPELSEVDGKKKLSYKREKILATQKTYYAKSKPRKITCAQNAHTYACVDKGKYTFKCIDCSWHRVAPPITFKFNPSTGHLTYRKTGIRV